jgi:hypothetical protein
MQVRGSLAIPIVVVLYTAGAVCLNAWPRSYWYGAEDVAVAEGRCNAYAVGFPFYMYAWTEPAIHDGRNYYDMKIAREIYGILPGAFGDVVIYLIGLVIVCCVTKRLTKGIRRGAPPAEV